MSNLLGHAKRSSLVFTNCHEQVIGDYTPIAGKTDDKDASVLSAVNDLVPSEMLGVFLGEEGSDDELRLMMLLLFLCPQEWIWVVLNLNLPK
jgi:hypothetical protein